MSSNNAIPPSVARSPLTIQPGETRRLTTSETVQLRIGSNARSALPELADSIFLATHVTGGFEITRMPDTPPPFGVEVAMSLNQVCALFVHIVTCTSARPELADSKFRVRHVGPNDYLVMRTRK